MNRLFATVVRAQGDAAAPDAPIRFVASSEGTKRDGLDLKAGDWEFTNYMRNPIVGWSHDYVNHLPIGRGVPGFEGTNMILDATFDRADPFAAEVERKVRAGFLNAVSVAWNDVEIGGRVVHDLLEVSVVQVPADPQALAISRDVEPDGLRVGAVLSQRNREALEKIAEQMSEAVKGIRTLLKSAAKPKEEPEGDKDEEDDTERAFLAALQSWTPELKGK